MTAQDFDLITKLCYGYTMHINFLNICLKCVHNIYYACNEKYEYVSTKVYELL